MTSTWQPVRNPEIKYTQVVTAAAKELLCIFIARRHMHHALYGISRPSVTRVDQSKQLKLGPCNFTSSTSRESSHQLLCSIYPTDSHQQ